MDVSIIIPIFNPDKLLLEKIKDSLRKQRFAGKKELILVDKRLGLADSMNYGIRKAKYPIVITLHQDCVPEDNNWLKELVSPLEEKDTVCSVSKVELPLEFWDKFDSVSKILSSKEQDILTPQMDEKGCAYKREILIKIGLFDSKNYRTAGEDYDMYIKLTRNGNIFYPNAKVMHYHHYTYKKRLKKEYQLSNAFGALVKIHKSSMPGWYKGFIKSIPILGYPLFFFSVKFSKLSLKYILFSIPLLLVVNLIYSVGFWKGFLMGRQTV